MVVVLMGVAGSGKTTVGRLLAASLGWRFIDGDALHPRSNVAKMRAGIPLDDVDRDPWINELTDVMRTSEARQGDVVVACSALRASHRARLREAGDIRLVYLKVDYGTAYERLEHRAGHFMPPILLQSQLDALQEPHVALEIDGRRAPAWIVAQIVEWLNSPSSAAVDSRTHAQATRGHGPEARR